MARKLVKRRAGSSGGFAIVLTLIVVTMMTVLVIGFNAATRTEQMAARNFSYQEQANQMAMLAVNRGIELLNRASTNSMWATQPGRYLVPGGGVTPLTSAAVAGGAAATNITNINIWQSWQYGTNTYTNYFVSTNMSPTAFAVPLIDVTSGTNTNVIGRYGFWIDDDGSRVNLNAAAVSARTNFLPTNARPLLLSSNIFPKLTTTMLNDFNGWINPASTPTASDGWGWFFTPRQLSGVSNIGTATYNSMMFAAGGGPLNWRASNSFALGSSGVAVALDVTNGFLQTYGSSGYAGSLSSLNTALDGVAGKFFRGGNYSSYFGNADGFAAKYGSAVLRQIIANIHDASLSGASGAFTGANTTAMLLGADTTGTNLSAPSTVLGLRPSLFLNEVAVGAAYSTNSPANTAEVQVWMTSELVDPYNTGQGGTYEIRYKIASLQFNGTYMAGGSTVNFSNTTFSANWNYDGGQGVTGIGTVPAQTFKVSPSAFVFEWQLGGSGGSTPPIPPTASNISITRVTVKPAAVLLRQRVNTPNTVRDWAVLADFPTNGFVFTNPPPIATAFGYNGSKPAAAPDSQFTQSIEKNDPRVRRFGTNAMPLPAWRFTSDPTLGANNDYATNYSAGTGISGIGNDRVGTIATIYNHPSFNTNATNFILGRSNWISAFDLSKIHTGLQWRTLQFRAQDAAESAAGHVPDWALLEVFAVTNTNVAGPAMAYKLNINSLAYPAGGGLNATELLTNGLARPQAPASLLASMTNAAGAAIGTNNLGFPAAAGFASASASLPVATNIASLAFINTWASRRSSNAAAYQTNLYTLPAEVLEISNVSNFSTDEAANEARAQGIYTGVTVSSQVFTVYAAGFATDRQRNVVAESRMRAQVARDTNTGKFRVVFMEPLVWP